MKILIVTLADENYWPIARISVPNKATYAAKHGYDFLYHSERWMPDLPASMSKMPMIANNLEGYDWIFWTDADSLIMNSNVKLESIIEEFPKAELIAHFNQDGLNCGQMLIKNSGLFPEVYTKFCKEVNMWAIHKWWEQGALQHYCRNHGFLGHADGSFNRMVVSGPEHNTFDLLRAQVDSVWQRDDFILHFAGMGGERSHLRLAVMEDYLSYAV